MAIGTHSLRSVCAIAMSMMLLSAGAAYAGDCDLQWDNTIGLAGPSGPVHALAVFDDGSGPALYVGGDFTEAGGVAANNIAKWDGTTWSPLGTGMNSNILALAVFDDGNGAALYAAGSFTEANGEEMNYIAKWDGTSWSPLGDGFSIYWSNVNALAVFDDGTGPALYAGGFTSGPIPTMGWWAEIRKWNGEFWAQAWGLSGSHGSVLVLHAAGVDSPDGPFLYGGGTKVGVVGQVSSFNIGKWDGDTWSGLAEGLNNRVNALGVFDVGSGDLLYAGGVFTEAGASPASRFASWDGSDWSEVGGGMNAGVSAMATFDDGSGTALYVGGGFTMAGDVEASSIVKWDGTSWSPLGAGVAGGVGALAVFDDGTGPALYVGGSFTGAGGLPSNNIARWGCASAAPACTGDLNDDGEVDVLDLLSLLAVWGDCPRQFACAADLDASGVVDVQDLLILLGAWGPCPE